MGRQERPLVKIHPQLQWRLQTFWRYQYYGIITKDNSNSGVELAQGYLSDKLIMLQKADMDKWNCTGFETQKIVILSQTSSTELFTVLYFGLVLVLL